MNILLVDDIKTNRDILRKYVQSWGWQSVEASGSRDAIEKLSVLSKDAQYDLACACGTGKDEHP